jgi:hypothetical protein
VQPLWFGAVLSGLKNGLVTPGTSTWRFAAACVVVGTISTMLVIVFSPWFYDPSTFGFHDWDVVTSYRYLVKLSLLRYGEFPGWNPYACGGYPAWGYVEGGTALVSPWLPFYLLAPLSWAIRFEAMGQGLLGVVGAYLLGARFTRSHGARLVVVALWALNGRWGLQLASGHAWHLAYAWMPWCLLFYDRARSPERRLGDLFGAGLCFAMLVYSGGIYPLPHTILVVSCYAVLCAVQQRSLRPLWTLLICGAIAVGLAAPKLLPIIDTFGSDPRLIASKERLSLNGFLTLLTSREQGFHSRPARLHPYGWHEWGMYISAAGVGLLCWAVIFVEGRRERALKAIGLLLLILGFGAFHPWAPWTLLHEYVPIFKSQHVPSRFLYPAVLVLAVLAAAGLGRAIDRRRFRKPYLDLVLAIVVAVVAIDVALVARQPMKRAMWMVAPDIASDREFHFEYNPPFQYVKRDWAGPMLLAMMGNTGVINCYGTPRSPHRPWAAKPITDRRYRGQVYLQGPGKAEMVDWSPNSVTVSLSDTTPGSTLIYNMNYWPGWQSDAGPVQPTKGLVSVPLGTDRSTVRFWYRPPGLAGGLGLSFATLFMLLITWRANRRAPRGKSL